MLLIHGSIWFRIKTGNFEGVGNADNMPDDIKISTWGKTLAKARSLGRSITLISCGIMCYCKNDNNESLLISRGSLKCLNGRANPWLLFHNNS
jgi:hypothetical protein